MREVASLGPISPSNVMYSVPRAGQMGFHQRTEYDKRIMVMGNTENNQMKINPGWWIQTFWFSKRRFHHSKRFSTRDIQKINQTKKSN